MNLSRHRDRLLAALYRALERLMPTSATLGFASVPDVDDNALALFAAVVNDERLADRRLVWLVHGDRSRALARLAQRFDADVLKRCVVVRKNSLRGFWHFLRARQVFFTHGHYRFVRASRSGYKLINLWHGMPLKAIGLLHDKTAASVQACDATLATSAFFQPLMARAFGLRDDQVAVTGLPRCDGLLHASEEARALRRQLVGDGTRLIAWLPTYRHAVLGEQRNDSSADAARCLHQFEADLADLSALAARHRCAVLVKLHPMDFLNHATWPEFERITVLRAADPRLDRIGLYDLLATTDGLITDVSSVGFDYMITRRPILITRHLLADYVRPLLFDQETLFRATFTCARMADANAFFEAVKAGERLDAARISPFCRYPDGNAARRVIDQLIVRRETTGRFGVALHPD